VHQFTDGQGRQWDLTITTAEIETIQDATGIDFGEAGAFERAFSDTKTFAGVLWCLVAEQAKERNLTPRDVKRGLDTADIIAAARDAVAEELIRFFPKAAPILRRLDQVLKERATAIEARATEQLNGLIDRIAAGDLDRLLTAGPNHAADVQKVVAEIRAGLSGSSSSATDSAASPASTPAP
jgi:hypothetical protein